ncbi:MAG: metallophosphoesterase family protein, partial [Methanobacteriota archaeon]
PRDGGCDRGERSGGGRAETVELPGLAIHGIPQTASQDDLDRELSALSPRPDVANVLTLHGVVSGLSVRGREFNEQTIPGSVLHGGWDYVALGHVHARTRIRENAWYAGSTERLDFGEAREDKGLLAVELSRGREPVVTPVPLPTRPMIDLPPVPAATLSDEATVEAVYREVEAAPLSGAVVRLRVLDIPRHVYGRLDFARLRKSTKEALHFELSPTFAAVPGGGGAATDGRIGPLASEFDDFLSRRPVGDERDSLSALARTLLSEASS